MSIHEQAGHPAPPGIVAPQPDHTPDIRFPAPPRIIDRMNAEEEARHRVTTGWEKLDALLREPNLLEMIEDYELEHRSPALAHLPVDIDWPRLLAQEASGVYRIWAVRVDETLAGFIAWYVEPHPYYRTVLFAVDGGHFLAPAFRNKGRIGWRMWVGAIAALRREGVLMAMLHDSAKRPMMPFFLALGAEPLSTWWILDLAHENHD